MNSGALGGGPVATALVTGASSGIGLEFARQLGARGYRLVLVSNEAAAIEEAAAAVSAQTGAQTIPLCLDLSGPESARELFDFCCGRGLAVSVLVNNAGIFSFREVADTEPARLMLMLNLHVTTVTLLCRYFGQEMRLRGAGYILNLSSLSAWTPFPGIAAYAATKAYIRSFTRSFGLEMEPHGVAVLAVCPGAVATDLYRLPPRYQRLGLRLGILMSPQRLVSLALRALFGQRHRLVPGVVNRLFVPLVGVLPRRFILFIKRKIGRYEQ